ncbi:MAG TPA: hypothetical protein VE978_13720 [Chitinophagales bacterium]|nr:hypothetical protein [Chitinophagales bacterium]
MKIPLGPTAFWDVDMNTLDEEQHADFIITRIFRYGMLSDLRAVLKHYSRGQIQNAFKTQRGIDRRTIDFARALGYIDD